MDSNRTLMSRLAEYSIWGFAFGYFACYVPYSFMTKVLTKGLLPSLHGRALEGFSLLPVSAMASTVAMIVMLSALRWWRYATQFTLLGISLPRPTRWTFLSGICTALIIGTTTLAYTFEGVSIVFAMLLMRGGVLIIAPIVDALTGRHVRWFSWAGLAFAMCALVVSLIDTNSYTLPLLCAIDIAIYLASYFVRLRFMSRLAKSEERDANRRYFVEEQMIAGPILIVLIGVIALIGGSDAFLTFRAGFTDFWGAEFLWAIVLIGVLSQGTGFFGSLIFLDKRENTFCVPVNRSSSILAGVIAAFLLMLYPNQSPPSTSQLAGAGFIIFAILFLTIPPSLEKRKRKLAQAAAASPN